MIALDPTEELAALNEWEEDLPDHVKAYLADLFEDDLQTDSTYQP